MDFSWLNEIPDGAWDVLGPEDSPNLNLSRFFELKA